MIYQHIENLLIRFRGQQVNIQTSSGGVYEGTISYVTNDYVAFKIRGSDGEDEQIIVLLHSIESVLPQGK